LHVLQEHEFEHLGGEGSIRWYFAIEAGTSRSRPDR
jgi:hypothetical protein